MKDLPEKDRVYYQHAMTGDRGYSVVRNGVDSIRYDRPEEDYVVPHRQGEWKRMSTSTAHPKTLLVQVAYEADRKLCSILGRHSEARREWLELPPEKRIEWMNTGPKGSPVRELLFHRIMNTLIEHEV